MQTFSKVIQVPNIASFIFRFTKIYYPQGFSFSVDVQDIRNNPHHFNMVLKDNNWKIVNAPKVEDWILELENHLSLAIFEKSPDSKSQK